MKILLVLILLFPTIVFASPFIISDPDPDCVTCWYEVDGEILKRPTEADGSIKYDLSGQSVGQKSYQFRYGVVWTADAMEGEAPVVYGDWSPPFSVTRPAKPGVPGNPKLKP